VQGKVVLVTGGAGSFGQAFVRRCLEDGARKVVVFSRDEAKQASMAAAFNDPRLRFLIGDVRDDTRLLDAMRGVNIVVHAAALKRVEICEDHPNEATRTNVYGTQAVARACIERGVQKAVLLSTDKAAAPNTLYGTTKLAAERIWIRSNVYSAGTATKFSATRYGNVLGSRGSVVQVWREQAKTGTLTITNPLMSRFWMTMSQAVDLVMLAIREMRGGEVFVPKIGAACISDLATAVAPGVPRVFTGLRPGEKMDECLVTEDEARSSHDCGDYLVIEPEGRSWGDVAPLRFPKVPEGYSLRSNTARQLNPSELRQMVAA
jgi:UDP-N-acetylglucosamine 4,6-dehydratase/5-epimerase